MSNSNLQSIPTANGDLSKATETVADESDSNQGAHTCARRTYTINELAKMAQVSRRTMQMSCRIVDNCIPEIGDAVTHGKVSIRDAYKVCRWPHWLQRIALEKVLAGKCKTLADA